MINLKISTIKKRFLNLAIVLIINLPLASKAQNSLEVFLDSALINNPEAVSIHSQIRSYQLDDQMISALIRSPKAFLSSEVLLAPYLNNQGKPIDTNPSDKAVGYDIGITNGGLYSILFNLELPLLKGRQVMHLQEQNRLEVEKLKIRLKLIETDLKKTIGRMYFDALTLQLIAENNRQNSTLLNEEFQLIKSLTSKGLYRIPDYKLMELELKSDSIILNSSVNELELAIRQLKAACGIRNHEISKLNSPLMVMSEPVVTPSLFVQTFAYDSAATVYQQKVFNDRYQPQLSVYANSGLNSTSIPLIERHIGASAGVHLTYTLFDGHQKKINDQQQLLCVDEASSQKKFELNKVKKQADAFRQTIEKTKAELFKQKQIQTEYKELLQLYQDEVKRAQISIIDLIAFLKKYSCINLDISVKEITLNKLINEYNYWNH